MARARTTKKQAKKGARASGVGPRVDVAELITALVSAKAKARAADCLTKCMPQSTLSLLQMIGEYLTVPGPDGKRVLDAAHAELFAQLFVDAYNYEKPAFLQGVQEAVTAWNDANTTEEGHTTPFV